MAGMEGMRLGAYELIERIGGGGMAEVYRAKQLTAFGREVAIKVIRAGFSEDASFRERFLREAQAISKLSHPNILPLIEFGEQDTTLYLVMPLAREGTLRDLLKQRNGPLPLEEAIPLFVQLCGAVQHAHEEGIIHRDLKPQNVLIQQRTHVLLADFGIARDTTETQMTATGAGIGTVEYMAPEQAVGQATKLSDIYSLGIVLYQMITGTVPYSGSTPFQVLMKHTNDALPDPRLLNPSLPVEIIQVLQSALAKDPQRRFQSAQALGRAVQHIPAQCRPRPCHPPQRSCAPHRHCASVATHRDPAEHLERPGLPRSTSRTECDREPQRSSPFQNRWRPQYANEAAGTDAMGQCGSARGELQSAHLEYRHRRHRLRVTTRTAPSCGRLLSSANSSPAPSGDAHRCADCRAAHGLAPVLGGWSLCLRRLPYPDGQHSCAGINAHDRVSGNDCCHSHRSCNCHDDHHGHRHPFANANRYANPKTHAESYAESHAESGPHRGHDCLSRDNDHSGKHVL